MSFLSGIFIALGALGAASITYYASFKATQLSREQAEKTAKIQLAMKMAEMRREWIESLRKSMSEIHAAIYDDDKFDSLFHQVIEKQTYLDLHFKPNDPQHHELRLVLSKLVKNRSDDDNDGKLDEEFVVICQSIIKTEWDRLKADLEKAKI